MSTAKSAVGDGIDVKAYGRYTTIAATSPAPAVLQLELNRPAKRNAMNKAFWVEMREVIEQAGADNNVRAIVLTAAGPIFTAGLDLMDVDLVTSGGGEEVDVARRALAIRKSVLTFQNAFNGFETIPQPVIAAIHSACVGGGVDLISACDIRLCSSDAWFSIKEVDICLTADVGTFPRLLKITGNDSVVRELAFTAAKLDAKRALAIGLVSNVYPDRSSTISAALAMASEIAAKSPIAIAGIKHVMNYGRDHSTSDGLHYVATWNMAMLQSQDVVKAATASLQKQTPIFSKL